MARRGVFTCAIGLGLLSLVSHFAVTRRDTAIKFLQAAVVCFAFTSATVVSSLTSYASLQCDEGIDKDTGKDGLEHPQLAKGAALGLFRSSGQLGRAIGPLLGKIHVLTGIHTDEDYPPSLWPILDFWSICNLCYRCGDYRDSIALDGVASGEST